MKQTKLSRFEILSTFDVSNPICAVYSGEDGKLSYRQVVKWAMVKEHRYYQDHRGIIFPEEASAVIDNPMIEGIIKDTVYEIDDKTRIPKPVWVLDLACDSPDFEGYVDGVEGQI